MIEGKGEARVYRDGQEIFCEGDVGNELFVIKSGAVRITRASQDMDVALAVLREGEFFAEMALFEDDGRRSATATALGDAMLLAYDKRLVLDAIERNPKFALGMLRALSHRLRDIDDEVVRLVAEGLLAEDEILGLGHFIYGGSSRLN